MELFTGLGRIILILGAALVVLGGIMLLAGKIPGVGRLPGDILVQRGNFTFYFPIVTMLVLSLLLTLILNVVFRR
ncbi:MAG: DUF2905 domain-containing protein [Eubacteriales bacterium]|nr:DUF2905 domain-containing protein [Bacillota bacterium]MBV1727069.1 DUF2905 domain-containing protein [Desulforudis sp.]MDP3051278.1 DUF2905 domain-containing protein [Eubacteriales bacterium]MDQ7789402.1 DUF2905 domain-containing protein [Clostridia bacterium]MBU4533123.1 DUF2905 domain-containing protein [Bacillota bacterium]